MSIVKKIENWFLSKSNSYNFYKQEYEKNQNKENSDPDIEMEFNEIKEEFELFKRDTNNQMDTVIYLMRTLFIDYEINNPKNPLKNIQDLSHELLLFIANLCDENDFQWWLDFGNLLGAVRHGSFIPWDDEIDIAMMRKDYIEFNRIIAGEIKKRDLEDVIEVKFNDVKSDEENSFGLLQLIVKSKENDVLGVLNVYPYDFMENYNKEIKKQYRNFDLNSGFEKYYHDLGLSLDQCDYIVSGVDNKIRSKGLFAFKTKRIFPLQKISFGQNQYWCPNDTNHYLKKIYGDYFNIPNIISIPQNVDKFRYNENNDELFAESINRIREANSRF